MHFRNLYSKTVYLSQILISMRGESQYREKLLKKKPPKMEKRVEGKVLQQAF